MRTRRAIGISDRPSSVEYRRRSETTGDRGGGRFRNGFRPLGNATEIASFRKGDCVNPSGTHSAALSFHHSCRWCHHDVMMIVAQRHAGPGHDDITTVPGPVHHQNTCLNSPTPHRPGRSGPPMAVASARGDVSRLEMRCRPGSRVTDVSDGEKRGQVALSTGKRDRRSLGRRKDQAGVLLGERGPLVGGGTLAPCSRGRNRGRDIGPK